MNDNISQEMWQEFCQTTNTDINMRHDIWKFCDGSVFADKLANLVLFVTKAATASTKFAYEMDGDELPSVILFNNNETVCIIRDVKVTVVPFDQVSAEHAYKEGEDDRSLEKWREVQRCAFMSDYR